MLLLQKYKPAQAPVPGPLTQVEDGREWDIPSGPGWVDRRKRSLCLGLLLSIQTDSQRACWGARDEGCG